MFRAFEMLSQSLPCYWEEHHTVELETRLVLAFRPMVHSPFSCEQSMEAKMPVQSEFYVFALTSCPFLLCGYHVLVLFLFARRFRFPEFGSVLHGTTHRRSYGTKKIQLIRVRVDTTIAIVVHGGEEELRGVSVPRTVAGEYAGPGAARLQGAHAGAEAVSAAGARRHGRRVHGSHGQRQDLRLPAASHRTTGHPRRQLWRPRTRPLPHSRAREPDLQVRQRHGQVHRPPHRRDHRRRPNRSPVRSTRHSTGHYCGHPW